MTRTEGSVTIGGIDVREIGTEELMKLVSFVFQDSRLFKDSLLNNIRAARPDLLRVEEVMSAIRAAQCGDIIKKCPGGLIRSLERRACTSREGSAEDSPGRAILKDAPIVVLDEATAFADPDNEYLIQQTFEKLVEGKTVIMIAHRLSTVCRADCIYVMEEGRIAEQGKTRGASQGRRAVRRNVEELSVIGRMEGR